MASRNSGGPPPLGLGHGRYQPSPRRQVAVRLPSSAPASNSGPTGQRRSITDDSGLVYPTAAMLEAAVAPGAPNPKIAEIQSRVEELVRRYEESVAAAELEELKDEEEDDLEDNVPRAPARWRLGDVLLSTHRALARTSTHTERTIIAEFGDDPEVSAAIGSGAQRMGLVFSEAADQAVRRHQRLAQIQQSLHSVGLNGNSLEDDEDADDEEDVDKIPLHVIRERQLRSTIDALHREHDTTLAQLQDVLQVQRDACVASEQQSMELSKAQRALRTQAEELRLLHESNEKAAETANALTTSWRDKFQACAKAATAAETRAQELEAKVRAQSEEIVKHTFVLHAKIQEMEHFKESEAARTRAEAAAHAAALTEAEAETRRAKAKAHEEKRKTKANATGNSKDMQEMEAKVRELEGSLLAAENCKRELESENGELSQRLRELQARFGELRRVKAPLQEDGMQEPSTATSGFALRLRENAPRGNSRKRQRGGVVIKLSSKPAPAATIVAKIEDVDLSSSESEAGDSDNDAEVDEVERDERELNRALQEVVAMVFPVLSSVASESALEESIAQYEDPARSPLRGIQPSSIDVAVVTTDGNMVPRSELDTLRELYDHEVDALKQQYVDGLQEYKTLVIEQYGRRQAIERERHHLEIEGLLRLIQTKFHAELSRRSQRLKSAKESLKVLYNALRHHTGPSQGETQKEDPTQPFSSATPLKTLLRAAILAMSTSAKRNGRGRMQIEAIHEQLTKIGPAPDTRTRAVAAAMTIHTALHEDKPQDSKKCLDASCQTDVVPVFRGRRADDLPTEQHVAPESLDGYVLPGSPCLPRLKSSELDVTLHLLVGIPLSAALVAELRRLLPSLPPGNYYMATALRLALFHELVRFYAAVEFQSERQKLRPSPRPVPVKDSEDQVQSAAFVVGSPRDTPFLRRKALEAVEGKSRQRNRRQLFTAGGVAILQTRTSTCPPNSR